ncbi:MAG: DEAD/DEAH box helicase family protein [Euryarchaeota archaeon]|nr:DEAD/DEAH box helicase family protein [Euryarchaeota archaeon]
MARTTLRAPGEEVSQLLLSKRLADEVDQWASDDLSVDLRWKGTTETTHQLLRYWFSRDEEATTRFHDCQRRAIETLIYCHEVRKVDGRPFSTLQDLYSLAPDALAAHAHIADAAGKGEYPKYCLKLATGTGKTWILQAALVWQYFNTIRGESQVPFSQHFLVVTPGLVVLERLLDAFLGKKDQAGNRDANTKDLYHHADLFIPPEWRRDWRLKIFKPEDLNASSPALDGPFVLLLNWHKLLLREEKRNLADELFGAEKEDSAFVYRDFLAAYPDLVIFNDEAHHVHSRAKSATTKDLDAKWLEAIKDLRADIHENHRRPGLFMQVDFSATPFYGESAEKREYFPHIIFDYDLKNAMHGYSPVKKTDVPLPLVKQLFLEKRQAVGGEDVGALDFRAVREAEDGKKRGAVIALSKGQILLLEIGIEKLDKIAAEFEKLGQDKKPVLYVACEENDVANLVEEHLRGKTDTRGRPLSEQLLVIHSDKKHDMAIEDWEKLRFDLDTIDQPEDVNKKRIVVSVMMLREGFDVRNICVAVILRASESPILLEQMVGRGLRLMFNGPDYFDSKLQSLKEIQGGDQPAALLDFLFIVEHPKFQAFYDNLRKEGYPVFQGDSTGLATTGDLVSVRAEQDRIARFDLGWPVQFHEEGRAPDPHLIDVSTLKPFPLSFEQAKKSFGAIVIADLHEPSNKITSTWRLDTKIFDYAFFLRELSRRIVVAGDRAILSSRQADLMAALDDYVSHRLFEATIDFSQEENYRLLMHVELHEHVFNVMRAALQDLLGKVAYEYDPKALWERVSKAPEILVRTSTAVETQRSIYPRQAPHPKGGGFEARFMAQCLGRDSSIKAFVKLDQHRHRFAIRYRNEFGIARDYFPDFLVKTADKMYLVETKADKDMLSPVVSRKARAAQGWCEGASRIKPPAELDQPQSWEYVLLSEKTFARHAGAGFEALLGACRVELEQLMSIGSGRLF